jgi:acetyltransferase-like isoleucine patch superfamily enzyme
MFDNSDRANALRPHILSQFASGLMTDDERARHNGLPEGCRMRENAKIYARENLVCGNHVWIGENAKLDARGGLTIGDHTSIGLDVFVWSHTNPLTNLCLSNASGSPLTKFAPTVIGAGCFIAGPSVIFPGCTVGDGCVILPFSSVSSDLPPFSLAAGAPAKRVAPITSEWVAEKLDELPLNAGDKERFLGRFLQLVDRQKARDT